MRNITPQPESDTSSEQAHEIQVEVMAPSALGALERASVDTQVATAHAYPRSIEQFRKRAFSMVKCDVETAESCMYSRPVGKELKDGRWVPKFAQGPSIRLAEIVAASYGNLRATSHVIEQTDRYVKAEGMAWDLETNVAIKKDAIEATVYSKNDKYRAGQPYDDQGRIRTAKAACAKALRDAIFSVVPRALIKPMYEAAKAVVAGSAPTIEQRRAKAAAWLKTIGVSDARAFAAIDVRGWSEVGEEQLEILTGLKTAISEDLSINEAFPHLTIKAEAPAGPAPIAPLAVPPERRAVNAPPAPAPEPKIAPEPVPVAPAAAVEAPVAMPEPPTYEPEPAVMEAPEEVPAPKAPEPQPAQPSNGIFGEIRALAKASETDEESVMAYMRKVRLARPDQKKLEDLSTAKLENLKRGWSNVVNEIKG